MSLISSNQPSYNFDEDIPRVTPAPSIRPNIPNVSYDPPQTFEPTTRIFSKAAESYSLTARNGNVVLAPANPRDHKQHWIKDMVYGKDLKDEEGLPTFALVNKGTGQAMKHPLGPGKPVRLVPFNPDIPDESILWSESYDLGDTFRCIRMANNICLSLGAFNGDDEHGGVQDGTPIVLYEGCRGKNQRWRIASY